jgi:hypothetical protein
MKRLSIGFTAFLLLLVITGAGFRKATNVTPTTPGSSLALPAAKQHYYYWYTPPPDDSFNDFNTLNAEINELFWTYLVIVDQNSAGGTPLMRGYMDGAHPHDLPASVFLYGHF